MGFGAVALQHLQAQADIPRAANQGVLRSFHHAPRVKHVIFCYMSGGVSHVDSFDPKPRLAAEAGRPMPMKVERTQFNNNGNIMPSPFTFAPAGKSGLPVSSMFPQLAEVADELAVIRSMTSKVNEHAQGNFFMHTSFPILGYPSAGAWIAYGLGTENQELPAYVVLQSGGAVAPHGGVSLFSNAFLPANYQGSILQADKPEPVGNIVRHEPLALQRKRLDLIERLDRSYLELSQQDQNIEAAIRNYETAFKMQTAVPELCSLQDESAATLRAYGIEDPDPQKSAYGRQCLLARRMIERGVRFVELSCLTKGIGAGNGPNPWDQHSQLEAGHRAMAYQVDQPIAALIADLRQRGLLDETLIVWTGEFGRTPFSQGSGGRDHNPYGFSLWLAGGKVRGGTAYGATDEYGYHAIENICTVYDLWATVLHLLGIDHERLTFPYGGRDMRLTDVHGQVLNDIL